MRTPAAGERFTQWVIQSRIPPAEETAVVAWERYPADPDLMTVQAKVKAIVTHLRDNQPEREWRVIRVETVQRVEDW